MTPIGRLQQSADYELKLGLEPPDTLTVEPAERCTAEFSRVLKAHKPELLALLKLPFVMVYSEAVEEMLFFCQDEATRAALVQAGADPWSIYTRAELQTLCVRNRVAPLSPAELRKVHEIKRTVSGRITS
jgi:hypothetical protein